METLSTRKRVEFYKPYFNNAASSKESQTDLGDFVWTDSVCIYSPLSHVTVKPQFFIVLISSVRGAL